MSNLPSEAFLLSGTSALHGDGCLSLATLDELLCLLRERRKEEKKQRDNCKNWQNFLSLTYCFNSECVCGWISWQVCWNLGYAKACFLLEAWQVSWGSKSTELHGYKVCGLTKKSFQTTGPYSSFPNIPLQEKRLLSLIFGLGSLLLREISTLPCTPW